MNNQDLDIVKDLIGKFKKFINQSIDENDKVKEENKRNIKYLINQFVNEDDPHGFKSFIKEIVRHNEDQMESYFQIDKSKFDDNKREEFYRFIELFKEIYQLDQ